MIRVTVGSGGHLRDLFVCVCVCMCLQTTPIQLDPGACSSPLQVKGCVAAEHHCDSAPFDSLLEQWEQSWADAGSFRSTCCLNQRKTLTQTVKPQINPASSHLENVVLHHKTEILVETSS